MKQLYSCGALDRVLGLKYAVTCVCCSSSAATPNQSPPNQLLVGIVEALFKFPPFFDTATKKVRNYKKIQKSVVSTSFLAHQRGLLCVLPCWTRLYCRK
jgi:hypothetical protein